MSSPEQDKRMVQDLLALKVKLDEFIREAFGANSQFFDTSKSVRRRIMVGYSESAR